MALRTNSTAQDAHDQLVRQLCEALSTFVAATAPDHETRNQSPFDLPANDHIGSHHTSIQYDDVISLRGILLEFGLKQAEVATLRKHCGFPAPVGRARPIMFRRDEVEEWIRSQPNPSNLAVILRFKK